MDKGRILAIDVGTQRTGLALSDERWKFAFPYSLIESKDRNVQIKKISEVVKDEEVTHILIGIPINQEGKVSQMGKSIRLFGAKLKDRLKLPIIEWDESYTSAAAERVLIEADVSRKKRKQFVDKLAASILLQSYLDSLQSSELTKDSWETQEN